MKIKCIIFLLCASIGLYGMDTDQELCGVDKVAAADWLEFINTRKTDRWRDNSETHTTWQGLDKLIRAEETILRGKLMDYRQYSNMEKRWYPILSNERFDYISDINKHAIEQSGIPNCAFTLNEQVYLHKDGKWISSDNFDKGTEEATIVIMNILPASSDSEVEGFCHKAKKLCDKKGKKVLLQFPDDSTLRFKKTEIFNKVGFTPRTKQKRSDYSFWTKVLIFGGKAMISIGCNVVISMGIRPLITFLYHHLPQWNH